MCRTASHGYRQKQERNVTSETNGHSIAVRLLPCRAGTALTTGKKKSNSFKNTPSLLMTRSALALGQERGVRTPAQNALRRRDSLPGAVAEAAGSQQGAPAPHSSSEEARLPAVAKAARSGGPRAGR